MAVVRVVESRMLVTSNGPEVSTILVSPDDAFALMVFGPGSATPIHRPLMVQMAEALAHQGIATFRYNYPYSERETVCSSDPIDSLNVLLATARSARDAARALSLDLPLFLGGTLNERAGSFACLGARGLARCARRGALRLSHEVARPAG